LPGAGAAYAAGGLPCARPALPTPLVVEPGQDVRLAGTDVCAVVTRTNQGVAVYGEIAPAGTRQVRGYFFFAEDGEVAVGKAGAGGTEYLFVKSQPPLPHRSPAPGSSQGAIVLQLGEVLRVDGTALVLAAGRNPGGEASLAVVLMPGTSVLNGSYEAGISEHEVVVLRWNSGKPTEVLVRAEPGSSTTTTSFPTTTTSTSTSSSSIAGPSDIGKSATLDGVRVKLVAIANGTEPATVYDAVPSSEAFNTATLEVTDAGKVTYDATSNGSTAIVGSDGKTYWPDIDYAVAGCGDFSSGGGTSLIELAPGQSETGCVHFIVPASVEVRAVAFSPEAVWQAGQYIVWKT